MSQISRCKPLAISVGLAGLMVWWLTRDSRRMIGGLIMLANWPWTLMMIAPVNSALNATLPDAAGGGSVAMIERWGQLHTVRTVFGACALLLFLWAISAKRGVGEQRSV